MAGLTLKSNIAWNSVGSLTYSMCQWLITVLVVRLASSMEAAGTLALAMAVSNVFQPIALYRMRSYQVSDIHENTSSGEYIGMRIVTIAIAFVISVTYGFATNDISALPCIILYIIFRAGDIFIDVLHGIDQKNMRMDYCGQSLALRGILMLIGFSAALKATGTLEPAVIAMILFTYPVIILDARRASQFASVRPVFAAKELAELLKTCFPSVLGMAACNLTVTYSRQYLSYAQGPEALGIYASICTPIVIIQACAGYVYSPLLGFFATLLDNHDAKGFRKLLFTVVLILFAIFGIGGLGFFLFGDLFIGIVFGEGLRPYTYLIYTGILSCACTACVAFLGDLLIAKRDMMGNCIGNLVSLMCALPLAPIFINTVGMNGASLAVTASYIMGIAVMLYRLLRE